MALNVYRRHRRECKSGHPEEFRSSEFDERKKGWKRCDCPIFGSGTLARRFRRQSTGQWQWDDARAVTTCWEQAGSWDGTILEPPRPTEPLQRGEHRITIADATKAFLAKCQNRWSA